MKAIDIMSTDTVTIDGLATVAEAARVMKRHQLRALIVDRSSHQDAYGIITATDISSAVANDKNPETTYVCEVMTKPCIVVNPDLAVEHIARLFERAKIHVAPVIRGKLLGIISLSDIVTKTKCSTTNRANSSSPKIEKFAESSLDETLDSIYENWCSG